MRDYGLPTHVRFAHPDAGYQGSQESVREAGLVRGQVYTLRSLQVGQASSYVELGEVRGQFNSVHFEPADGAGPGPQLTDDDLRVIARLLGDEQDHTYRDGYTWGPNGVDQAKWLSRVRRVQRKVQAIRAGRRS
jgi:hypothetical protein